MGAYNPNNRISAWLAVTEHAAANHLNLMTDPIKGVMFPKDLYADSFEYNLFQRAA